MFNENAVFISVVMLINSAHVSGFVIFSDDLRFLALVLLVMFESKSAHLAARSDASAAAWASASASSSSACFSAAILSSSSASASKSATASACSVKASWSSSLALFNSSSDVVLSVVLMGAVLLVRIGNGVLVEVSSVTGTEVVEVVGGLLVVMELVEVSAVTGTEVVGGLVVVEVKVEVGGLMVEVEQPQEVEVDETPAIRSSLKLIFVEDKIVKCAAILD